VGQATRQHLRYAVDFHQANPPVLQYASRDPLGAGALVCAFLLANDPSTRQKQLENLECATSDSIREEIMRIWHAIQSVPQQARIPLVDLALPALRRLSPQQFEQFRATTEKLVASKAETDLFVYMLRKIVVRHLERNFFPQQRPITQFYALRPLAPDCGALLSAAAYGRPEKYHRGVRGVCTGSGILKPCRPLRNPMVTAGPMRSLSRRRGACASQPSRPAD